MELHPRFQQFVGLVRGWKHSLEMGDYGAPSKKPTWLYSSDFSGPKNVFLERFGCVVVDHLPFHWNGYPTLPSHMSVQVTSAEVF